MTGFLEIDRALPGRRPVEERLKDYQELEGKHSDEDLRDQAARCMDCGIPFCHKGCPLGNIIPDWNDLVFRGRFEEAIDRLHSTNNFPEFTGRVCPAPCEEACVLGINEDAVTIKQVEKQIIEQAWSEGWVKPLVPAVKTGRTVAVVGSGPAGMAAAQQLARVGHDVTVFERASRIGGLMRYGIPDFKMEKHLIDRRMEQMEAEGVTFRTGVAIGKDISAEDLKRDFDAVVVAAGSTAPRDLPVPGRELKGVHFAMDFLPQQNQVVAGDEVPDQIKATGKNVVIIGGGDTGSDCLGTSNRQGAKSVNQFELLPQPPEGRGDGVALWPYWPMILRTSSSHEEGVERQWSINTKKFTGDANGNVTKLHGVRLEWTTPEDGSRPEMKEVAGSEFEMDADLVLLAMGFLGPEKPLLEQLGVDLDGRGNVVADDDYATNVPGVFACGDARRGQSLVVWAIWEGREAARGVDAWLMGATELAACPMVG
ncbi:MAG: glutamate synthase subunit beta [Deltaproteobacteria bacterium]